MMPGALLWTPTRGVARLRGQAATEKALRERIARQYPALHQSETRARSEAQQVLPPAGCCTFWTLYVGGGSTAS
ncbi:hypothetical protein [Streptomyces anulatus]|uniref:hypothetical protein n=1 Tax=Streptomyces anulatus TaxID=1892 RepID=UPI00386A4C46